ncbi:hypothetical protein AB0M54_16795 [Actinoplanes sp. NPDC051470]|uniref:hypothetical protein n=1 Tax=unclassified Actinoplanes TaxID=2626549 RepID=UPI003414022A
MQKRMAHRAGLVMAAVTALLGAVATPAAAAGRINPGGTRFYDNQLVMCYVERWGGTFYCDSHTRWITPYDTIQDFVIGTDRNVWTKWNTETATSEWVNMGGNCDPNGPGGGLEKSAYHDRWNMVINCWGLNDHRWWHRTRYSSGSWDPAWIQGWKEIKP